MFGICAAQIVIQILSSTLLEWMKRCGDCSWWEKHLFFFIAQMTLDWKECAHGYIIKYTSMKASDWCDLARFRLLRCLFVCNCKHDDSLFAKWSWGGGCHLCHCPLALTMIVSTVKAVLSSTLKTWIHKLMLLVSDCLACQMEGFLISHIRLPAESVCKVEAKVGR